MAVRRAIALALLTGGCGALWSAPTGIAPGRHGGEAFCVADTARALTAAQADASGPPGDIDVLDVCHGTGGAGGSVRAFSPADDELGSGLGVGVCSHGALALVMRSEYAIWAVGDADTGDWGAMGDFSLGFGGPLWPLHVLAGAGLALPLWDEGELDLNSTWLYYAGIWLYVPCGGGRAFSASARYTWYSEEATLGGRPVDLDGWSVAFSWYY